MAHRQKNTIMTERQRRRDKKKSGGSVSSIPDEAFLSRTKRSRRDASKLLAALARLARELGDTRHDEEIVALLAEACSRIFPGRRFDIHLVEPSTGEVRQVYANSRLLTATRGRLTLTQEALSEIAPEVLSRLSRLPVAVEIAQRYEAVFENSATGFDVAIHDHLALYGGIRVEYVVAPTSAELASDRSAVSLLVRLVSDSLRASRLLEETLQLKDYLEKALESADAPMVAVDSAGVVTFVNGVFERLLGRTREELLGSGFVDLFPSQDRAKVNALVSNVLRGGARRSVEVRYGATQDHPAHHLSFTARPISSPQDEIEGLILVGQDLTELRTLESQVIHSEKLATLGQVAAGVAHELNNPLTSITIYAEYLLRKLDGTVSAQDSIKLQRILDAAIRIQGFTRDLVAYARPSGEEPINVNIHQLVTRALSFCEHILASSKAQISVSIPGDLPPVYGIRGQLEQVVVNLVTNACQALPEEGGQVSIEAFVTAPGRLRLSVTDTGRGIPPDHLERVFEPFYSTKVEGQGTGLGLSIVRNILVNHGAEVSVQSEVGRGTTFFVELDAS